MSQDSQEVRRARMPEANMQAPKRPEDPGRERGAPDEERPEARARGWEHWPRNRENRRHPGVGEAKGAGTCGSWQTRKEAFGLA